MGSISIRPIVDGDREAWFRLWQGYLDFYETTLNPKISKTTWRRLLDADAPINCLVATDSNGQAVGILNYILHANTWTDRPVCYLEDLFVDKVARGQGAGRALIESLIERARAADWHRIYWMTKRDNATARLLYDKITPVTEWVRYDVNLGQ